MPVTEPKPQPAIDPATLLRGRDILCFSHDWSGDPLSKTHLMRVLAKDNRILWVNSIGNRAPSVSKADVGRALKKLKAFTEPVREVEPNIFVLNPLIIPAYGNSAVRAFNTRFLRLQIRRAMRKLGCRRAINMVFNPAAQLIAGKLGEAQLIYYCVDEYSAFTGVGAQALARQEEALCRMSDIVIVSAERLRETKAPFNHHTYLVRHGVDFAHFSRALDQATVVPSEIAQLPRPVIGFHGLIADWVDLDLIKQVAQRFSSGSVVLIGKTTTDTSMLADQPNIHLLGRKPYAELPAYCKGFDVALNPFRINELTLNANPLKVREYLAAGLPVVSTRIPEVEVLGQCLVGNGAEFIAAIETALEQPGPCPARSAAVRGESWEARVDEIRVLLAGLAYR